MGRRARGEHLIVTTGTASGKTLAFNLPVLDALAREPKSRALYLYPTKALAQDQARALGRAARAERPRGDLRRRHAEPSGAGRSASGRTSILTNPDMLHVGVLPHHDRWGDVLTNLALRRRRRGARLPRRLRLARRERAAAAAAARARLRRRAAVPARLGDDREPRRARARAARASTATVDRRRRRAARRADDRALEPAAARRRARPARERARRGVAADGGARRARPAHDLLREEPQGGRADPPLHRRPARATTRDAALSVPRRLHARAAPRDRAAARRGRAARRLGDGRARARHRHRPARLRDLGRLPGHGRAPAPAVGPRRPPRARARGARRERGRARPVLHARAARRCSGGASRRRSSTTRTRACSTATSRAAAFEAPLDDADRAIARRRGARARGRCSRSCKHTKAGYVWAGRDYPAARVRAAARRARTRSRSSTARAAPCSASSSASARTRPCTRARSTSTSARATSCASSTCRRAPRVVEPFTGDYYTQAKKETTTAIEEPLRAERRLGLELAFGRVVRDGAGRRATSGSRSATRRRSRLVALDLPADDLRDRGDLVRPGAASSSRGSSRCRRCSARCTRPSTR